MDIFEPLLADIRIDSIERKINATVKRNRLIECLDQMDRAMAYHRRRVRN